MQSTFGAPHSNWNEKSTRPKALDYFETSAETSATRGTTQIASYMDASQALSSRMHFTQQLREGSTCPAWAFFLPAQKLQPTHRFRQLTPTAVSLQDVLHQYSSSLPLHSQYNPTLFSCQEGKRFFIRACFSEFFRWWSWAARRGTPQDGDIYKARYATLHNSEFLFSALPSAPYPL